jgi:hypothetical protein
VTPLVILGVVAASWALRPESRKLRGGSWKPMGESTPYAVGEGVRIVAPPASNAP